MDLRLEEMRDERPGLSAELQSRAFRTPWTDKRVQYVVYKGGNQVAILFFDLCVCDGLVLYELFVAKEYRRRGIGTALIREAEVVASSRGYSQLVLRPRPLEDGLSCEQLVRWYRARGFTPSVDRPDLLRKEVHCAPPSKDSEI